MFTGPGKIGQNFSSMVISHGMRQGMKAPSMSSGIGRPRFKGFSDGGGIAKRDLGGLLAGGQNWNAGAVNNWGQASPAQTQRMDNPMVARRTEAMMPMNGMYGQRMAFADGGEVMEPPKPDSGYLKGDTAGRADKIITKSPNGSYIIPADVVSHLGEGNSEAGGKVLKAMLGKMERDRPNKVAIGGASSKGAVPVALSHGEFQVSPQHVALIGRGDLKRGHEILDKWVQQVRADHIKTLKKLKPPIGAKKSA